MTDDAMSRDEIIEQAHTDPAVTDGFAPTPEMEADAIIDKLSDMDIMLLMGRCAGWGSWMWDSGKYMVALGIGTHITTRTTTSIQFDTPLAALVKARILEKETANG